VLTVEQARDAILNQIDRLGTERVSLLDAAGRVSAEEVRAERQQPPWDNSAMDGYAVRAADLAGASEARPVSLRVLEDLVAGVVPTKAVGPGEASRIMTGAPVPPGADAVIKVELTRSPARSIVEVLAAVPEGNDIRRAGEDQEVGDLLIAPGKLLRPAEIGVLAAAPRALIRVYRRPTVAVIATGDELAEPDTAPRAGQIVNTNAYAMAAMVKEAGGEPRVLPIARDSMEALGEVFREAEGADLILSSGGVSVGEHDFVKEVLEQLGVQMGFWKVKMTPGKPLAFGKWGRTPVIGLPGNPVSSLVTFELFVRPALLKMAGRERIFRRMWRATIEETVAKRPGMPHFLRVTLREEGGRWYAASTGAQGSGILRSMSKADALAVGEEPLTRVEAGSEVWVMPLDEQWAMTATRVV
jgi:molybdopterin molybdotransferase